ncbi:2-amino-4-hydroxy-6-hydroxymethyldihydropteridine diphosphokinase [Methylohalomonas lacus]|uniref:2-amino-4-hydroxy-6-hydroxymethyldihydropteridine pyrophosphokinase n=1 Tax=Methylohalomonas lacus TaxID=398773 RepID=A0AAE3HJD3_9GAMM|nr:2-amino-4-hydroxy-6-hydroxymethyldihydropteridine diphosphokinase [Methylohalomonas lacus]MCS3902176.1 2-amino-4-hydroxy-6-hydroxymethyldihydropteridine diphosphokinase [Methylohalomonas lacus]
MTTVYIGLGSNLDAPRQQLASALAELGRLPETDRCTASPLYRSRPVGPQDQPDYLNAVACLETRLAPLDLLDRLQAIEQQQGRRRDGVRWGARTLDLDVLLYGDAIIDSPRLTVPHPEMANRGFVLKPLHDLAPNLAIPGLGPVSDLLARMNTDDLEVIADAE